MATDLPILLNKYKKSMVVQKSLKNWFVAHFIIDIVFALPLMFFPEWVLNLFMFSSDETVLARVVAAALIGVGTVSLVMKNANRDSYIALLNMKLIWSASAVLGLVLGYIETRNVFIWLWIIVFIIFFAVWGYYRRMICDISGRKE
jgi:hypothetical protein